MHRLQKGFVGVAALGCAFCFGTGPAWAAPSLSPSSGPSGTRLRAVDAGCPSFQAPTLSLVSFEVTDRTGAVIASGRPPDGGRFVVDGQGTGIVTGPPGDYPFNIGCSSTVFSSGPPLTDRPLTFGLTGPEGQPAPSGPGPAAAQPAAAPAAAGDQGQAEETLSARARARAVEVQARNADRQAAITARAVERDQAIADRAAERDARAADRKATRAAELAERAAERAAR